MPEAAAHGILKVNVRQTAANPWKVVPVDSSGTVYTFAQVLGWIRAAMDRNGA